MIDVKGARIFNVNANNNEPKIQGTIACYRYQNLCQSHNRSMTYDTGAKVTYAFCFSLVEMVKPLFCYCSNHFCLFLIFAAL